jgi:hypothetical protein
MTVKMPAAFGDDLNTAHWPYISALLADFELITVVVRLASSCFQHVERY